MTEAVPAIPFQLNATGKRTILRAQSWNATRIPAPQFADRATRTPARAPEGELQWLQLGPADWLIVSDALRQSEVRERIVLAEASDLSIVDLTHGLGVLELQGLCTRDVLAKACGLDLHPTRFGRNCCTRTRLARIAAVVHCLDEQPRFEIYMARSYTAYLQSWLQDAALEFL